MSARLFPDGGPDFTVAQRIEFVRLGLFVEQIEQLRMCLRAIRTLIECAPPVGPVRKRMDATGKALEKASRLIRELIEPFETFQPGQPARTLPTARMRAAREVEARLLDVADDPEIMGHALDAIEAMRAAIKAANGKLPPQRRYRVPWSAVERVANGLLKGFIQHHNAEGRGLVRHGDELTPHASLPPYELSPSRSGAFAEIVAICWQAAGSTADPDRAIREYVEFKVERAEKLRRQLFGDAYSPARRKRGRPTKVARNRTTARRKS